MQSTLVWFIVKVANTIFNWAFMLWSNQLAGLWVDFVEKLSNQWQSTHGIIIFSDYLRCQNELHFMEEAIAKGTNAIQSQATSLL